MTLNELQDCMNLYITLWKSAITDGQHRDSIIRMWQDRGLMKLDKDLLIKALYEYEDTCDKSYIAPRVKQIKDCYNNVKARVEDKSHRRIETPEEVMANMFHEEMKKPHQERDYDLLDRTKYYAGLFQDDEAYKKHFGKSREEFERL